MKLQSSTHSMVLGAWEEVPNHNGMDANKPLHPHSTPS